MPTFFNHNQILAVKLLQANALKWKVGDMLIPFDQAFHLKSVRDKKRLTIAYADGPTFRSLADGHIVTSYDALATDDPIPMAFDCETVSFKSTADKQRSGVLYTNKLEYSLPKMTEQEYAAWESQNHTLLDSGNAYHILLQLYSCDAAYAIVLCPERGSFSALVDDNLTDTKVTITIKNLSTTQFLE